jgi:hypothetical protein
MKTRVIVLLFLLVNPFIACQKETSSNATVADPISNGFKKYSIPQSEHSTLDNNYQLITREAMRFMAQFDSSCIYYTADTKNSGDINKLYGFSDCGSFHHENSARIGWVWNGRAVDLYAYCYVDSIRNSRLLTTVDIGEPIELSIRPENGQYLFGVNGETICSMKRGCTGAGISGYQLYPYFGGDETAPHEIRIYIKDL